MNSLKFVKISPPLCVINLLIAKTYFILQNKVNSFESEDVVNFCFEFEQFETLIAYYIKCNNIDEISRMLTQYNDYVFVFFETRQLKLIFLIYISKWPQNEFLIKLGIETNL